MLDKISRKQLTQGGEIEGDLYWTQFLYIALIEWFDVHTAICGFIASETSRIFVFLVTQNTKGCFSL